jgi:leucyl aminopeptidase
MKKTESRKPQKKYKNNVDKVVFYISKYSKNSYLYVKAAKSFFNGPREKLSPRPLAAEADNLEDRKFFYQIIKRLL